MNKIKLMGTPVNINYSHTVNSEKFYSFFMSVARKSGFIDTLHCIVSEIFLDKIQDFCKVGIIGTIRTRTLPGENHKKLDIYVFVDEISEYEGVDKNEVVIEGFTCKKIASRTTPTGRDIADVLIANNRERSNKSDYIPSIFWGRNAHRAENFNVGTKLKCTGRLQSREYIKKYEDGTEETKTAYELSVLTFEIIEEEK